MSIPASAKYSIIQEMTQRDNNLLNISWLCEVAQVSRSGYYSYQKAEKLRLQREAQDYNDFLLIARAYKYRGFNKGARGIYMRFLHMVPPVHMNIKKIRRLMKKYELYCPIRRANPYRRMARIAKTDNYAPNLVNREFEDHGPRAILLTDITYIINGKAPRCYMSTIIDGCTKELLAWVLSESLEVDFVLETVQQLIDNHGESLTTNSIYHSDQGSTFSAIKLIDLLNDYDLRRSMSRRANCWDNAPQESFYGHMKDDIDITECETFDEIYQVINDWVDYYNNERYQWDLAKLSPKEYHEYIKTGIYPLEIPKPKGRK